MKGPSGLDFRMKLVIPTQVRWTARQPTLMKAQRWDGIRSDQTAAKMRIEDHEMQQATLDW